MMKIHHANILLRQESQLEYLFDFFRKELSFDVNKNPDFLLFETETFGIEDARNFEKWATHKPLLGEVKIALLAPNTFTLEAQNALLKLLEEPTEGTYIFISLGSLGGLLPTLLSRVQILDLGKEKPATSKATPKSLPEKFLSSNIGEKLALIRSLVKNDNKSEMKSLIQQLEQIAFKNDLIYEDRKNILTAKIFSSARGASSKMILEWLSCVL